MKCGFQSVDFRMASPLFLALFLCLEDLAFYLIEKLKGELWKVGTFSSSLHTPPPSNFFSRSSPRWGEPEALEFSGVLQGREERGASCPSGWGEGRAPSDEGRGWLCKTWMKRIPWNYSSKPGNPLRNAPFTLLRTVLGGPPPSTNGRRPWGLTGTQLGGGCSTKHSTSCSNHEKTWQGDRKAYRVFCQQCHGVSLWAGL